MAEKLCLQWNDFKQNISTSFRNLRGDKEFTDVTLACEDGQQVEAHKAILASSSPFFKELLMKNKHPHPLLYMRALRSEDLVAMVDFLYFGEANVFQENLDSFLALAEELKLKGLTRGDDEVAKDQEMKNSPQYQEVQPKNEKLSHKMKSTSINPGSQPYANFDTTVAAIDTNTTVNASLEDLDRQISSMITRGDVSIKNGKLATCNICGKEGIYQNVSRHIEASHISGVSHTCEICGTISRSRNGLRQHKMTKHPDNDFVTGAERA